VALLDATGWIRVTGSDRVRWLNGMVSNFTQQLAPGEGCYNFVLNAQGRIQGDLTAFAEADAYLLETRREQVPALMAHLDRFIIMDDVELADITETRKGLLLVGPRTPEHLEQFGVNVESLHSATIGWHSADVQVIHAYSPLVPRYELWSDAATIDALSQTLVAAGASAVSRDALEQLRLLEGTPRYGADIRDKDLPQETAQTRALHFAKGCYLGQEIVERIRSRGNVHRTFTGFTLTGPIPQAGAALQAEGKAVGELTSFAAIQLPEPVQLALGYVRREALDRGHPLKYPGGIATPIALPYPIS
jgi:folate-binding protein YgfZ